MLETWLGETRSTDDPRIAPDVLCLLCAGRNLQGSRDGSVSHVILGRILRNRQPELGGSLHARNWLQLGLPQGLSEAGRQREELPGSSARLRELKGPLPTAGALTGGQGLSSLTKA